MTDLLRSRLADGGVLFATAPDDLFPDLPAPENFGACFPAMPATGFRMHIAISRRFTLKCARRALFFSDMPPHPYAATPPPASRHYARRDNRMIDFLRRIYRRFLIHICGLFHHAFPLHFACSLLR